MADVKDRAKLPPTLRPDIVSCMPFGCRFGWHHWFHGEVIGYWQKRTCMRCGRVTEAWIRR